MISFLESGNSISNFSSLTAAREGASSYATKGPQFQSLAGPQENVRPCTRCALSATRFLQVADVHTLLLFDNVFFVRTAAGLWVAFLAPQSLALGDCASYQNMNTSAKLFLQSSIFNLRFEVEFPI